MTLQGAGAGAEAETEEAAKRRALTESEEIIEEVGSVNDCHFFFYGGIEVVSIARMLEGVQCFRVC